MSDSATCKTTRKSGTDLRMVAYVFDLVGTGTLAARTAAGHMKAVHIPTTWSVVHTIDQGPRLADQQVQACRVMEVPQYRNHHSHPLPASVPG